MSSIFGNLLILPSEKELAEPPVMAVPTILSHGEDLDGVASAVLAAVYLRLLRGIEPRVFFTDYAGIDAALRRAAHGTSELWVMDLSLQDAEALERYTGLFSKDNLVLADHHATSRPTLEKWEDRATVLFDDSGDRCAADLVWWKVRGTIVPHIQPFTILSSLMHLHQCAHDRDLWQREISDADDLTDVIAVMGPYRAYRTLRQYPHQCRRTNFDEAMELCVEVAERDREASRTVARATRFEDVLLLPHWQSCLLVTAQGIGHQSDVGDMLQKEANVKNDEPVIAVIYDVARGKIAFRASRSAINAMGFGVNDIAAEFGGGGHPYAAGAPMPPEIIQGGPRMLSDLIRQATAKIVHDKALSSQSETVRASPSQKEEQ